jgi:hypothetical protein
MQIQFNTGFVLFRVIYFFAVVGGTAELQLSYAAKEPVAWGNAF